MASSFDSLSLPEMVPCASAAEAAADSSSMLVGAAVVVRLQRKSDTQRRVILRRDMLQVRSAGTPNLDKLCFVNW